MEKNIDADNYVASPVANQSGSKLFQKEIISGFSRIRIKGALRWTEKNNQLWSFLQTDRQSIDTHQTFMMFCSTSCIQNDENSNLFFTLLCATGLCTNQLGCDETKPVFGVFEKARLKPVSSATETSKKIEISLVASLDMLLSN